MPSLRLVFFKIVLAEIVLRMLLFFIEQNQTDNTATQANRFIPRPTLAKREHADGQQDQRNNHTRKQCGEIDLPARAISEQKTELNRYDRNAHDNAAPIQRAQSRHERNAGQIFRQQQQTK